MDISSARPHSQRAALEHALIVLLNEITCKAHGSHTGKRVMCSVALWQHVAQHTRSRHIRLQTGFVDAKLLEKLQRPLPLSRSLHGCNGRIMEACLQ